MLKYTSDKLLSIAAAFNLLLEMCPPFRQAVADLNEETTMKYMQAVYIIFFKTQDREE